MNAKERKEKIKSIIEQLIDDKEQFCSYEEQIKIIFTTLDELDYLITKSEIDSIDVIDVPEIRTNILNAFINKTTFERMFERIEDFKSELFDYAEGLSNVKQEAIETKYQELEDIEDFIDYGSFETFDEVIKAIDDVEKQLRSTL